MSFDETIIHCSAPSLCGIKPACLFSMKSDCFNSGKTKLKEWSRHFAEQKRYIVTLKKESDRILFFVYDKSLIEKVLADKKSKIYLESKGYCTEKGVESCLSLLLHKLMYLKDFPHEVGLFLGYPLEDVIGFEERRCECILSGFWKVYSDRSRAEKLMNMYKSCSEQCMHLLQTGLSVPSVATKYKCFMEA